jgi:hypothetical protein
MNGEKTLVMDLYDSRNALERVMLHFTDLEKETERIDDKHYLITLNYKQGDETEILIRILSFGPVLKVTSPEGMVSQIRERLDRQMAMLAAGINQKIADFFLKKESSQLFFHEKAFQGWYFMLAKALTASTELAD